MSLKTSLEAFVKGTPFLDNRMGYVFEMGTYLKYLVRPKQTPSTKFIIFGTGRSGSTLLVSLIDSNTHIFCDNEIYHRKVMFPRAYREALARIANKEVYGFKLLMYHISLKLGIKNENFGDYLQSLVDDGYKIIHLRRHNIVRQALSNVYARHRGQFHSNSTVGKKTDKKMVVNLSELERWIRDIEEQAHWEVELLESIPHLSLGYEVDLEDQRAHGRTLKRVSQFLGVNVEPPDTELKKVTPKSLESFVENHEEVMAFLRLHGWAHYIENEALPQV
ncbi:MAG: hypothetical protein NWR72_15465 [Bacteroidia bacterium]|nr:hypothetical protein [Bacteroidia bacterium]